MVALATLLLRLPSTLGLCDLLSDLFKGGLSGDPRKNHRLATTRSRMQSPGSPAGRQTTRTHATPHPTRKRIRQSSYVTTCTNCSTGLGEEDVVEDLTLTPSSLGGSLDLEEAN